MRALLAALFVVLAAAPAAAQQPRFYAKSELAIAAQSGRHVFTIEIAASDEERAHGLMFRKSMPMTHGVLLDYVQPQPAAIWMKNTSIPLDIVFLAPDGTIDSIGSGKPHDLTSILPTGPARGNIRAVLELNAGTTRLLGIKPGDKAEHAIFAAK
jgi:hypothetical protein